MIQSFRKPIVNGEVTFEELAIRESHCRSDAKGHQTDVVFSTTIYQFHYRPILMYMHVGVRRKRLQ